MSIDTLFKALWKSISEYTEYEAADDDQEVHSVMLRRFRQATKIEAHLINKIHEYRRKAFMYDHGLGEEDMRQEIL